MTPKQLNELIKGFFSGKYHRRNLPKSYYKSFDKRLKTAINESFGSKKGYKSLYDDLSLNRQAFAGAKTYQLTRELQAARRGAKTLEKYQERAERIINRYEVWGEAEINTAAGNTQNAKAWARFEAEKDDLPFLQYSAIIDDVTSEICRPLDGIIVPVGHPITRKYSPCNHYHCRCLWEQLPSGVKPTSESKLKAIENQLDETVDDYFKTNVGVTHELFRAEHPYFTEVPKVDRAFARTNFGLPIR